MIAWLGIGSSVDTKIQPLVTSSSRDRNEILSPDNLERSHSDSELQSMDDLIRERNQLLNILEETVRTKEVNEVSYEISKITKTSYWNIFSPFIPNRFRSERRQSLQS